jgi:SWI/SNF-related matrix-associated actin-dependent regulator of chromatin subfamily A3
VNLVESVLCLANRITLPRSVVFSFWTYTLDLVESLLKPKSISYARIDGNLSGARREEAIQRFQTNESVRVILVSITCGGTG